MTINDSFASVPKRNIRGLERDIDSLGRLVIPKEYRSVLGIGPHEPVEIFCLTDGIFIRKAPVSAKHQF